MTRENVRERIVQEMDSDTSYEQNVVQLSDEVAMHTLICQECGSKNGHEPASVDTPDIKTDCTDCGQRTRHEYRTDGEVKSLD